MRGQAVSYAPVPQPGFPAAVSAPVAQLDRAPDYESGGQEFESLRARHFFDDLAGFWLWPLPLSNQIATTRQAIGTGPSDRPDVCAGL